MSKTISVVEVSNDNFGDLYSLVSLLANSFGTTVTVSANAGGEGTSGNGYISGTFGANTIFAGTALRGGNVSSSGNLAITSNLAVSGANTTITGNTRVAASSIVLAVNSSIDVISVTGNSSASMVTVTGSAANLVANVEVNGQKFRLPTGNSSNRPSGPSAGLLRYNTETSLIEIYSGSGWQSIVAANGSYSAAAVAFANNANIASQTVQLAIEETWNEKTSKAGDTFTGNVAINLNGLTLPTPVGGLQVAAPDSSVAAIEVVSFASNSSVVGRRSEGTNASKTAVANGSPIIRLVGQGYDGSSYAEVGAVEVRAQQTHNSSAKGTRVVVRTVANNSTTNEDVLIITSNNIVANAIVTALGIVANTGTFTTVTANDVTVSANLNANGALLTSLNANNLTSGTIPVARLPAANTSSNGGISIATAAEFRANSAASKALSSNSVWGAAQEVTLTYSSTTVVSSGDTGIDLNDVINGVITVTQNSTMGQPQNVKVGQAGVIRIVVGGSGSYTMSYHADWEFAGGTAPTISTTVGANDLLFYHVLASGRVFGTLVKAVS